jgi:putative DNA primase/helicase
MNHDFEERVRDVKSRAHGHWTSLLRSLGVGEDILRGRNMPCPIDGCGGTDRFQYTDKFGDGNYHCRACGAGGGLKLAHAVRGGRFVELLDDIERLLGTARVAAAPVGSSPSPERMKRLCRKTWQEGRPIALGDEVERYLRQRGLGQGVYPKTLRCHPALGYYEKPLGQKRSTLVATYPAMIACVQGADGHVVTLHRTYLEDGRKALGAQSKKLLSAGIHGAAVRLDEAGDELALTEGIETALAVRLRTGKPTWAALSCGNLERLWVPEHVARVCIYADNDADAEFAGQASAYALAQRLVREAKKAGRPRTVDVFVPRHAGTDWADIRLAALAKERQAA